MAATAVKTSSEKGDLTSETFLVCSAKSEPEYPLRTANPIPEAPATYLFVRPAWVCSSISILFGQPF